MRLAAVAFTLCLLPSARAHADAMVDGKLPEFSAPVSLNAASDDDAMQSQDTFVLPTETGAVLAAQPTGVTPEPSSVVLMGSGLLCFGGLIWRRRVASRAVAQTAS